MKKCGYGFKTVVQAKWCCLGVRYFFIPFALINCLKIKGSHVMPFLKQNFFGFSLFNIEMEKKVITFTQSFVFKLLSIALIYDIKALVSSIYYSR